MKNVNSRIERLEEQAAATGEEELPTVFWANDGVSLVVWFSGGGPSDDDVEALRASGVRRNPGHWLGADGLRREWIFPGKYTLPAAHTVDMRNSNIHPCDI